MTKVVSMIKKLYKTKHCLSKNNKDVVQTSRHPAKKTVSITK